MIKIFLCCAAGMSTSMVVNKMRQAAESADVKAEINAYSISAFETEVKKHDVCLVAPQVKYKLNQKISKLVTRNALEQSMRLPGHFIKPYLFTNSIVQCHKHTLICANEGLTRAI